MCFKRKSVGEYANFHIYTKFYLQHTISRWKSFSPHTPYIFFIISSQADATSIQFFPAYPQPPITPFLLYSNHKTSFISVGSVASNNLMLSNYRTSPKMYEVHFLQHRCAFPERKVSTRCISCNTRVTNYNHPQQQEGAVSVKYRVGLKKYK